MKPPASAALASAVIAEVAARELWMAGWLQARTLAVVSAEHAVQPSSNASGALQECMAGRHARVGSIDFDRTHVLLQYLVPIQESKSRWI